VGIIAIFAFAATLAGFLNWRQRRGQPIPDRGPRSPWPIVASVVVVAAVGLWFTGSLDEPLSHIGLNKNPCLKNAFGATFCGDSAKSYCDSIKSALNTGPGLAFGESPPRTACDEIGR
jgi:hypothetical protein